MGKTNKRTVLIVAAAGSGGARRDASPCLQCHLPAGPARGPREDAQRSQSGRGGSRGWAHVSTAQCSASDASPRLPGAGLSAQGLNLQRKVVTRWSHILPCFNVSDALCRRCLNEIGIL